MIKIIALKKHTKNQKRILGILSMLKKIITTFNVYDKKSRWRSSGKHRWWSRWWTTRYLRNLKGHGLKIVIPDQMLSILPITLAQLNAGNNF